MKYSPVPPCPLLYINNHVLQDCYPYFVVFYLEAATAVY